MKPNTFDPKQRKLRGEMTEQRRRLVFSLRVQGGGQTEIADRLRQMRDTDPEIAAIVPPKYSQKAVSIDLAAVYKDLRIQDEKLREDFRQLEVQRMDALWSTVYPLAMQGDLAAIDRAVRLMERRAKFLGLDAPAQAQMDLTSAGQPLRIVLDLGASLPGTEADAPDSAEE